MRFQVSHGFEPMFLIVDRGILRSGASTHSFNTDQRVGRVTVLVTWFGGKPGSPQCHGRSVLALARKYGGVEKAASALKFPDVEALQAAILTFCGG